MDFTLHQLAIFGTVAELSSVTKAAEKLHMTQPAVSIQLKRLQESVGMPLIEITGRKLYLTEAGNALYEVYESYKERMETFEATISQLRGGLKGQLSISAASTAKYYLPYLLGEFQRRYPQINVSLKVTNRNQVLQHLENNEYQLAILTQIPDDPKYQAIPFLENPLVMGAPPGHRLTGEKCIPLEELKEESYVFREMGSGTRMVMERILAEKQIRPRIAMELGTNEAVKQAIMAGIGISLISRLSLKTELPMGKIQILDVEGLPFTNHWHLVFKKNRLLSPVFQNFREFLKTESLEAILDY